MAKNKSSGSKGISPWIGWGISTLLLLWMNRKNRNEGDTTTQQPSKFTEDTGNQIGNCIPVVIGRTIIKNPLVSYYGDYSWRVYTEEYGMHSKLNVWPAILPLIIALIFTVMQKDTIVFNAGQGTEVPAIDATAAAGNIGGSGAGTVAGGKVPKQAKQPSMNTLIVDPGIPVQAGPYSGTTTGPGQVTGSVDISTAAQKRQAIVAVLVQMLIWLLMQLFNKHEGRTTIQKGFKYYLGWQHILCWTGDNFGLKRIWMNVYDSNVEQSTEQGVWGSDNIIWKQQNQNGIIAYIEDENMFGGVDEGGGFIGHIHFYFGTPNQPIDAWMQEQMAQSANVPDDLRGLTPRYPMFVTCVVNNTGGYGGSGGAEVAGGAYIGKQATVPEMWFEVVNYPSTLKDNCREDLKRLFNDRVAYLYGMLVDTANIEGVPEDAQGAYANLQSVANSYDVNNLGPAINATQGLLDTLDSSTELYRRTKKLLDLLNHGVWTLGRIDDDCNPAEVICEILINSYWGCNYDASLDVVDVDSLLMLGATCEEEGLGISCFITNTAQAYEYIDKILTHINAVKFDSNVTGKLTFKMIRGDYDISKLKIFNPSNCESLEFTRLDWSETSSSVSVNFTLADNKYVDCQLVVSDMANPLITGLYSEFNIDGTYFTVPKNARIMAQTQLLSAGYPLSAVNFVCNRYGYDLNIGDPIVVNWEFYGITKQIFRVTDIDYGTLLDGKITITALEDVFGFDQTDYAFTPVPVWTDPEEDPEDVDNYFFFEMPYEMTSDLNTYVYAYAAQPSLETLQWYVWRNMGTDFAMRNTSTKWSMMGRMVYGLDEKYDANDMIGFEITDIPNNSEQDLDNKIIAINNNPYIYTNTSGLNLLECKGEIMSYSGIERLGNGNYRIYGLIRGIYDTVPKGHVAYDVVHFLDYGLNINLDNPVCLNGFTSNEQLEITTSSQTRTQEFDPENVVIFDTKRRSESPSIMGDLQFTADRGDFSEYKHNFPAATVFCHDIKFKFKARNKFNDSLIKPQTDDSVDVYENLKNVIQFKCDSDEYEIMYNAFDENLDPMTREDFTFKWAEFCEKLGGRVKANNEVYIEIKTYNPDKELYSYDHYEKQIIMLPPVLVGIVENSQEAQDYANSIVYNDTIIQIPENVLTTNNFALSYEQAPLIFLGNRNDNGEFMHWDGTKWDITAVAYRIDGATEDPNNPGTYIASIHEVSLDDYYIFKTEYTGFYNDPKYYQRLLGSYNEYSIYNPPIQ